jgi:integrase
MQMNTELRVAIAEAIELARGHGASEPSHYLFPRRIGIKYDPTRPIDSWRKAWIQITHLAGLDGVRFHDIRHSIITELLSDPQTPQEVAMAISGHNTVSQLRHYNHVKQEQMFQALCRLEQRLNAPEQSLAPPRPAPEPKPTTTQLLTARH